MQALAQATALNLRPIIDLDQAFLYQVYASARLEEMALVNWSSDQVQAFLQMQFHAQHKAYTENYTQASFQIIEYDHVPIGRLYLARWVDEIRLMDIALLPEFRQRGFGTVLLRQVLAEAQQRHIPVRCHVEFNNPALHWYLREGFRQIEDRGVYLFLEWQPA